MKWALAVCAAVLCAAVPVEARQVAIRIGDETRQVSIRLPRRYTPQKRWPLIIGFHRTGGNGDEMIGLLERSLGNRIDEFVIAAPTDYTPLNIESRRAWKPEERLSLRELRGLFTIDSDRVYVTGFSQGCYAAWSYATFYGDELAAAVPVACTFDAAPEIPGLWEMLMPNLGRLPVLNVWGSNDALPVYGIDLKTVTGTAAQLNERVREVTAKLGLSVVNHRIEGGGHTWNPPRALLASFFEKRREQYPRRVDHRFRYLVQGRAAWIEPLTWDGDQWGLHGRAVEPRSGESREEALGRLISELTAEIHGEIERQTITVTHRHVGSLVVWIGEDMIDWSKPVRLIVNGREAFQGMLIHDPELSRVEAARMRDYDRLRWSGIRVGPDGSAKVMTALDRLPDVVFEEPK